MMKRTISTLLVLFLCLGLCACGDKKSISEQSPNSSAPPTYGDEAKQGQTADAPENTQDHDTKTNTVPRGPLDDAIEENLRLGNNLYFREDGSLFFSESISFETVGYIQEFELGQLPPPTNLKYAYMSNGSGLLIYQDGQMFYIGFDYFPGEKISYADMERSSLDIAAAVTTDGRVLRFIYVKSRDHGLADYEEVPELGNNVKYIRALSADSIIAVNGDGTVGLFGGENYPELQEITGWTNIAWITRGNTADKTQFAVGLKNDGTVTATSNCPLKAEIETWTDMVYLDCSNKTIFGLTSSGEMRLARTEGLVENEVLDRTDIKAVFVYDYGSGVSISAVTTDGTPVGRSTYLAYGYIPGQTQVDVENNNRTQVAETLLLPNAVKENPGDKHPTVTSWP